MGKSTFNFDSQALISSEDIKLFSQLETNISNGSQYESIVLYVGRTHNEALRIQQFGFEIDRLEQRQRYRQLEYGPGLYATTNRSLAIFFANLNALDFPSQGGAALIRVNLNQKIFDQLVIRYKIIVDAPLIILGISNIDNSHLPVPCIETVFPYKSLIDINKHANITIEHLCYSSEMIMEGRKK